MVGPVIIAEKTSARKGLESPNASLLAPIIITIHILQRCHTKVPSCTKIDKSKNYPYTCKV